MAFSIGSVIVAREDWRGYLHSAVPRLLVSHEGRALVDWSPAGTVGVYASSRQYSGREHLARSERKLLTLETCQWLYTSAAFTMGSLNFVDDQHWSSTTLGWSEAGNFLGWYVNVQRPIVRTEIGYDSMDLVVDVVVAPSYEWHCKDEADFETAIGRGIFDEEQRSVIAPRSRARLPTHRATRRALRPGVDDVAPPGRLAGSKASPGLRHRAWTSRRRRSA